MILGHTVFFRMELQCTSDMSDMYEDTSCFRLKFGGKICYFDCHRRFLPLDHSFRLDNNTFKKGNIVLEGPPRRLSGPEITDMLNNLVLKKNGDEFVGYENDPN
jgi:hypothetical protein